MPTSQAPILGKDFDETHIEEWQGVRACWTCDNDFLYDKRAFAGQNRVYCSPGCKTKGSVIAKYLRLNGYEHAAIIDYVDSPDDYPPLPENQHRVKPEVPKIHNHKKRKILHPSKVKKGSKAKLSKPRKIYTTQEQIKKREEIMLETEKLKKEERLAIKEEHAAINTAAKALGVLPLAEQPDVITGKITRFTEQELTHTRSNIMTIVQSNLLKVEKVMEGELTWTPVQANLFVKLLNKVVPNAPKDSKPPDQRDISKMTLPELEALAKQLKVIEGAPPKHEPEEEIIE